MSAYRRLYHEHERFFVILVIGTLIFLMISSKALANVDPYHVYDPADRAATVTLDDRLYVARVQLIVPQLAPAASVSGGADRWTSSRILEEVGKQAVDQPGHFLVGAGPIWASRYLVGVPWFGWVLAPILAYREWLQWPSNRWWDPPLDWAFLTLGAVAATWGRLPGRHLAGGRAAMRARAASGFAAGNRLRHAG
jgi:hypothetical protein